MNLKEIKVTDETTGEEGKLSLVDYQKLIIKAFPEVKAYSGNPEIGDVPFNKVVKHIVENLAAGKAVEEGIGNEYTDVVDRVTADVAASQDTAESKKAEAAAAAAAKKAEKEKAEAEAKTKADEQLKVQTGFVGNLAKGIEAADAEFEAELLSIKDNLPEGVSVVQKGKGFGVVVSDKATQSDIALAMGYLMQKGDNSALVATQLQFWVGDMVIAVTESKLFETAKDAGKFISGVLEKDFNKTLSLTNIDANKRMAQRTPVELRNPRADATAYLAISNMKMPKKGDKESDADFKKRLDAYNADILGLQTKLANGEIVKRKDILEPVNEVLYKNGIKERPSGDEPVSPGKLMAIFFHATFALENLLSVHVKDEIHYKEGDEIFIVTKQEMEDKKSEVESALANIFYSSEKKGFNVKDITRGFVETIKEVVVGKDADGKNIVQPEKSQTKVYPNPFWDLPKKEEGKPAEAPAAAETPAPSEATEEALAEA